MYVCGRFTNTVGSIMKRHRLFWGSQSKDSLFPNLGSLLAPVRLFYFLFVRSIQAINNPVTKAPNSGFFGFVKERKRTNYISI